MKQRLLFFLIILAALALCLLPALCFSQTVGQFGIPKWTAGGTQTQWVTPQNGKVFAISSGGALEMATVGSGGTLGALTDVALSSLANQQLLRYNSAAGDWENWTADYAPLESPTFTGTVTMGSLSLMEASSHLVQDFVTVTDQLGGTQSSLTIRAGSMEVGKDNGIGGAWVVTVQPAVALSANRTLYWPNETGTLATQAYAASASNISTGTLSDARLSANVSLFGASIDLASEVTGSLPLANIAQSAATSGQAIAWNGTAWAPATISAAPGGSSGQVQYNNAGSFAGASGFTLSSGVLQSVTTTSSGQTAILSVVSGNGALLSGNGGNYWSVTTSTAILAAWGQSNYYIQSANGGSGNTNRSTGNLVIHSGKSTGSGTGGSVILGTSAPGSSGVSENATVNRVIVDTNGVVQIINATTAPSSNPTGGGYLYSEGGALKWRSPGGTTTTIAPN